MFEDFIKTLEDLKVVPVVVVDRVEDAAPLAEALVAGGLPAAEVTLRTPAALDVIREMAKNPDILVGAGTVLSVEKANEAIDAGAKFIVSPGFDADVVAACIDRDVPVFPGTVTPTEIIAARNMGLETTKFFPAKVYGGTAALAALGSVFRGHRFMPTGGVNASNVRDYLALDSVVACGGTWMTSKDLLDAQDFEAIENLVREARELVS